MNFADIKKIVIPKGIVKKITCGGKIIWKGGFTNLVPLSINADGTIYNNGLGYKLNYRVRSGGAEVEVSLKNCLCTGFIPAKGGDTVRIARADFLYKDTTNAINVSNSSFTNLGQIVGNVSNGGYGCFSNTEYSFTDVVEETSGIYKWVVPPYDDIAYIRVTARTIDGDNFIVTVNEEIVL